MNYPNGKRNNTYNKANNKISHGNRGQTLEKSIDLTNRYYINENIAIIHKKPTPIQIVDVHYPSRDKATIKEAYFKVPSTTDYNGIYRGKYIDFEAKETRNKTSFPFINIHPHQVNHMKQCYEHDGVVFLIIKFTLHDEIFFIPFEFFNNYWTNYMNGGRKSIPYKEIKLHCPLIKESINPRINYIQVINEIYSL